MPNKDKRAEVIAWLKEKDLLSKNKIEARTGLPQGILSKSIKGTAMFSDKHTGKIIKLLKEYGFKN